MTPLNLAEPRMYSRQRQPSIVNTALSALVSSFVGQLGGRALDAVLPETEAQRREAELQMLRADQARADIARNMNELNTRNAEVEYQRAREPILDAERDRDYKLRERGVALAERAQTDENADRDAKRAIDMYDLLYKGAGTGGSRGAGARGDLTREQWLAQENTHLTMARAAYDELYGPKGKFGPQPGKSRSDVMASYIETMGGPEKIGETNFNPDVFEALASPRATQSSGAPRTNDTGARVGPNDQLPIAERLSNWSPPSLPDFAGNIGKWASEQHTKQIAVELARRHGHNTVDNAVMAKYLPEAQRIAAEPVSVNTGVSAPPSRVTTIPDAYGELLTPRGKLQQAPTEGRLPDASPTTLPPEGGWPPNRAQMDNGSIQYTPAQYQDLYGFLPPEYTPASINAARSTNMPANAPIDVLRMLAEPGSLLDQQNRR